MKRMIMAILMALGMAFAAPAAYAGNGAADFYLSGKCYIDGGPERLSVTNWDTSSTYQRYHMDLYAQGSYTNSSGGIVLASWEQYAIYFNGVKQSGTNDIYKTVSGHGRNTIKGVFRNKVSGSLWSCSLSI